MMLSEICLGHMHDLAQERLKKFFEKRPDVSMVYLDHRVVLWTGERLGWVPYHPDVLVFFHSPQCRAIWVEVDGKVGHSGTRSQINRETREQVAKNYGADFYSFSTKELVGRGWLTSRGERMQPWDDADLDMFFFGKSLRIVEKNDCYKA